MQTGNAESCTGHGVQPLLFDAPVLARAGDAAAQHIAIELQARLRVRHDDRRMVDAEEQPVGRLLPARVALAGREPDDFENVAVRITETERADAAGIGVPGPSSRAHSCGVPDCGLRRVRAHAATERTSRAGNGGDRCCPCGSSCVYGKLLNDRADVGTGPRTSARGLMSGRTSVQGRRSGMGAKAFVVDGFSEPLCSPGASRRPVVQKRRYPMQQGNPTRRLAH